MKHIFRALALLMALSVPAAHAAPPSQAQLDVLFQAMEMSTTSKAMLQQMEISLAKLSQKLMPPDTTEQDRALMAQLLQEQIAVMGEMMAWEKIEPIYRKVYSQVFTAEEVEAMTAFYSSEHGRSILHKMPKVIGLAMQEMQPLMQGLMQRTAQALEQGMQAAPDAKQPPSD